MAFLESQLVDIRRFCGYPVYGVGASGFQGWRFFQAYGLLEYRMQNMAPAEEAVALGYLTQLASLEFGRDRRRGAAGHRAGGGVDAQSAGAARAHPPVRRLAAAAVRLHGHSARAGARRRRHKAGGVMVDYDRIDDAIQRGRGLAAIAVGELHDLHRPTRPTGPVQGATAIMRMPALFMPASARMLAYGHPLFEAAFDAAYTQPGDYLVGRQFTWFVASQAPLLPLLCVKATRVVCVSRPGVSSGVGLATYGGIRRDTLQPVLSGWPASMVAHGLGLDRADLPADASLGGWSVLLPVLPGIVLRTGDLVADDLGRAGVVASVELSDYGWRLAVRQAAT